jgi:hypothetical protein
VQHRRDFTVVIDNQDCFVSRFSGHQISLGVEIIFIVMSPSIVEGHRKGDKPINFLMSKSMFNNQTFEAAFPRMPHRFG